MPVTRACRRFHLAPAIQCVRFDGWGTPLRPYFTTLLLASLPVVAYHSWPVQDGAVHIEGRVETVRYGETRAELQLVRAGRHWNVLLAPAAGLADDLLPDGTLQVGKRIAVEGHPRTDGLPGLHADHLVVDGKRISLQ